jgi:hypothetical protein
MRSRMFSHMRAIFSALLLISSLSHGPLVAADWNIESVDTTGVGRYSSLQIDKDGNAHLIYVIEEAGNQLRYGFWDHLRKKWFTMAVDVNASFSSLALDSKQRPHISYADFGTDSGSRLRYAYWDGLKWNRRAVPLDSDCIAYYTAIALDTADKPYISFYEYRGAKGTEFVLRLRAVSWTGEHWEVRTIDGTTSSGKFNAIAFDPQGRVRLGYANVNALTAGVRMATWDGNEWRLEIVDDLSMNARQTVGYSLGMTLDKAGIPHLSYWNINVPLVKYATLRNGRWVTEVVDRPGAAAYWDRNSIALDEDGRPYMSYYDGRSGQLRLAHKAGSHWVVEVVDSGFVGFTSSLQIEHGVIWIAYADETNRQLKVSRRPVSEKSGELRQVGVGEARVKRQPHSTEPEQGQSVKPQ